MLLHNLRRSLLPPVNLNVELSKVKSRHNQWRLAGLLGRILIVVIGSHWPLSAIFVRTAVMHFYLLRWLLRLEPGVAGRLPLF